MSRHMDSPGQESKAYTKKENEQSTHGVPVRFIPQPYGVRTSCRVPGQVVLDRMSPRLLQSVALACL